MKKQLLLVALCGMIGMSADTAAQDVKKCATDELLNSAISNNPHLKAVFEQFETDVQNRAADLAAKNSNNIAAKATSKYPIPLVFHVVLTQAQINTLGGTQGIYNRITTQIEVLNTDFNALNTESIPSAFAPLKGNPDMAFGLAHTKPNGSGTIGVEILVKPVGFGGFQVGDGSVKKTSQGGLDPWDNSRYLNVWICDITNGSNPGEILGYAYNPKLAALVYGDASLMGVCVDYLAFGKRTNITQTFFNNADKGRTMVHEFGHFFTLNHIWGNTAVGSGDCSDDDGVSDTPPQKDANQSNCPNFPKANCTGATPGEMFMNYMDYVQDACMSMFTKGQVTRMHSEFSGTGGSPNLTNNGHLFNWPTGIENTNYTEANIDVVPNPSNGIFTIAHHDALQQISILNTVGQTVKQIAVNGQQNGTYSVDLTAFPKGMYIIQCQSAESTVSKKIVIQ